jgi:hypothetical protein
LWVSKEVWPDSVYENMNHRPRPAYMEPSQGERCKCFIPRPLP